MNGFKTERRLLALAVALIYNCCLAPTERTDGDPTGGGRERLRQLTADRAFCCLLMKVIASFGHKHGVVVG